MMKTTTTDNNKGTVLPAEIETAKREALEAVRRNAIHWLPTEMRAA